MDGSEKEKTSNLLSCVCLYLPNPWHQSPVFAGVRNGHKPAARAVPVALRITTFYGCSHSRDRFKLFLTQVEKSFRGLIEVCTNPNHSMLLGLLVVIHKSTPIYKSPQDFSHLALPYFDDSSTGSDEIVERWTVFRV